MTQVQGFSSFRHITGSPVAVKVVDAGVGAPDDAPSYGPMLRNGDAVVVGLEPNLEAVAAREARRSAAETYLPCVVGDGDNHVLHVCRTTAMTSLLEPDPDMLTHFDDLPQAMTVTARLPVPTVRLDDIPQALGLDLLAIDVCGAETMVFAGGPGRLRDASVIHAEVAFLPLYRQQPLYAEIDAALQVHGFVLHRFDAIRNWPLGPQGLDGRAPMGASQHLHAGAIFIKDPTRLNRYTTPQLITTAAILHDCYGSVDVALRLLLEHDRRTGKRLAAAYMAGLQALPDRRAA